MSVDNLLAIGRLEPIEAGYRIRLPAGDEYWTLANEFAEEEAAYCAARGIEVEERARLSLRPDIRAGW